MATPFNRDQLDAIDATANDVTNRIMEVVKLAVREPSPTGEQLDAAATKIRQSLSHFARLVHSLPDMK